jgi:hypothetical protein
MTREDSVVILSGRAAGRLAGVLSARNWSSARMVNVDLVIALATTGALWFAITRMLTTSLRTDEPFDTLEAHLAAKTAPWREPPENRTTHKDLPA